MLCKIADFIVDVPTAGGLAARCVEYEKAESGIADIIIREEEYDCGRWPGATEAQIAYMESAYQFYRQLLGYDGLYLHASAVEVDGKAYLFSADSGVGKSTHTRLWQQIFGDKARVFNDDKPALRRMEDGWYAYGTPWCGKDGININRKVPLAGICFLKQAPHNHIRRLHALEALPLFLMQTLRKRLSVEEMDRMMTMADRLFREIPMFELENRPEPAAARLSYETMRRAAEEAGL